MKLEMRVIGIDKIRPNPFQPRETFEKESIRELAESIKEVGLLQPILVRPDKSNYQIISGERRWRASQFAGLKEIPVIIKEVDDKRLLIESLVENVHRKDLEPIEKGRALFELGQILGFFDEEGAPKVEKKKIYEELSSKTKVSLNDVERHLGLLELPEYIQREIVSVGRKPAEGKITEHHARVLRGIKDEELQKKVVQKIKEEKLTGVETEKLGKVLKKAPKPLREAVLKPKSEITPEIAEEIIEIPEETQRELLREIEERELPTEEIHGMVERRKREFFTGEVTEELEGFLDNLEELYHQVMEISSLQIEELSYELRDRCITYLELMKRHIEEVLEELGEMDYFGK